MDNIEFKNKLYEVANNYKTVYANGMFGQPITKSIIDQKAKQLPRWYTDKRTQELQQLAGKEYFGFDCICLIKGILWGFNGNIKHINGGAVYQSNGVPDISEYGMLSVCSNVSEDFSQIEIGEYLWLQGHCGIYVGDGLAIECTTRWDNKVQVTAVSNIGNINGYNGRFWEKHGKLPYIKYIDKLEENVTVSLLQLSKGNFRKNPQVYTLQRILKELGFYTMDVDGAFGNGTHTAVVEFQKSKNIAPDGIVGQNTWNKLLKE